jgi:cell division protein FtsX
MEDSLDTGISSGDGIRINATSKKYLIEISKWASFLAIAGFVLIGLMLMGGVFLIGAASRLQGAASGLVFFTFLVAGTIYFFPTYFLFMFAKNIKQGFRSENEEMITKGFENLKSMFKFIGVLVIIVIGFYVLLFLLGGGALFTFS